MPPHILYLSGFTVALCALFSWRITPVGTLSSPGLLQAAFLTSFCVSSLIAGRLLYNSDIKRAIAGAILILGVSSVLGEMLYNVFPTSSHVILGAIFELTKGAGVGMIKTASLSLISMVYLRKATIKLTIYEVSFSAGGLIGTTLASSLYTQGHKTDIAYLIYVATILVSLSLGFNNLVESTNFSENENSTKRISYIQSNTSGVYRVAAKPLTYTDVLGNRQGLLSVTATFIVYLQFGCVLFRFTEQSEGADPLLVTILKFVAVIISLVIICKGVHYLLQNTRGVNSVSHFTLLLGNAEKKNLLTASMTGLAFAQFIFGPILLNSTHAVTQFASYLASTGFLAIFLVTNLPIIVKNLVEVLHAKTSEATCVSVCIFNAAASGAQAFSIIAAQFIISNHGAKAYCVTLGWILLVFGLILYFLNTKLPNINPKYEYLVRSFQLNGEVEESGLPWEESGVSGDGSFIHKI